MVKRLGKLWRIAMRRHQPGELPAPRDPLEVKVEEIIKQIRQRKETSFMDMVPEEHGSWVTQLAVDAHPTKGGSRPLTEFVEDMALNWLAKKEFFKQVTEAAGFKPVENLDSDADTHIMAFSKSASIVFASRPGLSGMRSIEYQRIPIREDAHIAKSRFGKITGELAVGSIFTSGEFHTTALIALTVCRELGVKAKRTMADMQTGFRTVDDMTLID
jgi:hypothetical protein